MTLTLQNTSGTTVSGTTSAQAAFPGTYTPTTGDIAIVVAWSKHRTEATEPTAPAAWPRIASDLGGVTGAAQDAGKVRITYFARELTSNGSGDDAAPLISITTGTGVVLSVSPVYAFRKSGAGTYALAAVYVPQTSSATVWSGVTAATPDWTADDHLLVATGTTSDAPTGMGTRVLTATGCTLGGAAEQFDVATSNGDDQRFACATNTVTAGPASAAATVGITLLTTASTGLQSILRIRHVPAAVTLDPAIETSSAQTLTGAKSAVLGVGSTTETAQALVGAKSAALVPAIDVSSAVALVGAKTRALAVASSIDTAIALAGAKSAALVPATSLDEAVDLTPDSTVPLGTATETSTALALTGTKSATLTPAVDTSSAVALTGAKVAELGVAAEVSAAVVLAAMKLSALTPAGETSTAGTLAAAKSAVLDPALELSEAIALIILLADDGSPEIDITAAFAAPTWDGDVPAGTRATIAADRWGGEFG